MGTIGYVAKWAHSNAFKHGRSLALQSIILHSSCGHKAGDIPTLMGEDHEHLVSAHWYVDKQGNYYHLVQDADTAYHAGVVIDPKWSNSASIGIEQEHLDGQEDWPNEQVQATARLVVALFLKHGVLDIRHHADVASPKGRKTDPVDYPSGVFWAEYATASGEPWDFTEVQEGA